MLLKKEALLKGTDITVVTCILNHKKFLMLNFSEHCSLANVLSAVHLKSGSLHLPVRSLYLQKAENTEKLAYTENQRLDPYSIFKKLSFVEVILYQCLLAPLQHCCINISSRTRPEIFQFVLHSTVRKWKHIRFRNRCVNFSIYS